MRRNETLTFNGISLTDYGCYYDGSQLWRKPEKIVEFYSVPGKNGDVSISEGKFSNISRPFSCNIQENFIHNYNALINYLSSVEGYGRLETSEEPDVYMMAAFVDEIQPSTTQFNNGGTFILNFNFQPQKWLKSGENAIQVSSSISLVNPTHQVALPLIEVQGTGNITINSSVLALATNTGTTVIDCETQDCYEGTINRNNDLTITGGFPVLGDSNTISFTGFTDVKIYPRWWRL